MKILKNVWKRFALHSTVSNYHFKTSVSKLHSYKGEAYVGFVQIKLVWMRSMAE